LVLEKNSAAKGIYINNLIKIEPSTSALVIEISTCVVFEEIHYNKAIIT